MALQPTKTPASSTNTPTDSPAEKPVGPNPLDRRAAALAHIEGGRLDNLRASLREAGTIAADEDPFLPIEAPAAGEDTVAAASADTIDGGGEETQPAADPADDPGKTPADDSIDGGDEPRKLKVKIDGVEQEVTEEELLRNYSVNRAADARFAEATRMMKSVEALQERLNQPATTDTTVKPEPTAPATGDGPDYEEIARSILYATDPKEAGAALKKLAEQSNAKKGAEGVDPEAIQSTVLARVRSELEWTSAVKTVADEFKDDFSNPLFQHVAGQAANALLKERIQEARDAGKPRPEFVDVMRDAVKGTKEAFGEYALATGYAAPQEAPPPNVNGNGSNGHDGNGHVNVDTRQRVDAKRRSPQSPAGRAAPQRTAPVITADPADRIAGASSAIGEMRKARGQSA